jgi:hypothetical protein
MYTLSAMVHIEFVVLLLALAWLMWMVSRAADGHYLKLHLEKIEEGQAYAVEVFRVALTELIGVDKTDAVIESADEHLAEYRKRLKGNPDAK